MHRLLLSAPDLVQHSVVVRQSLLQQLDLLGQVTAALVHATVDGLLALKLLVFIL